ncbi:DMT family transporter [Glutamicibacter arilaitensis]|uniref:DMT family transporter n=1 Tax=Glutamicibacter arilaitensis TaxID=256701 RepID=UPI00384CF9D2
MVWIAITAALCGAFCLAFGAHFQSSAVKSAAGGLDVTLGNIGKLMGNGRWMSGLLLLGMGMVLNVFALASAPLTVVQPIGAIALVVTTVVNAREHKLTMNRPTVLAIASCMVGSAAFVLMAIKVTGDQHQVDDSEELLIELILACVVVLIGIIALIFHRSLGAIFYIVGAGVLFGFVAVLVRTIAIEVLRLGGQIWWSMPWLALGAVVVAGLLGSYFVQNAYSKGPPDLVIAGLTVIDPIVGIAIGITILGELRPDVPALLAGAMALAGVLAIVGVVALSRHHPVVLDRKAKARHLKSLSNHDI